MTVNKSNDKCTGCAQLVEDECVYEEKCPFLEELDEEEKV